MQRQRSRHQQNEPSAGKKAAYHAMNGDSRDGDSTKYGPGMPISPEGVDNGMKGVLEE